MVTQVFTQWPLNGGIVVAYTPVAKAARNTRNRESNIEERSGMNYR